jgi:hypothetical protein
MSIAPSTGVSTGVSSGASTGVSTVVSAGASTDVSPLIDAQHSNLVRFSMALSVSVKPWLADRQPSAAMGCSR